MCHKRNQWNGKSVLASLLVMKPQSGLYDVAFLPHTYILYTRDFSLLFYEVVMGTRVVTISGLKGKIQKS